MHTLLWNAFFAGFVLTGSASAATITVTGNGDTSVVDGVVTLREAISSIDGGANLNADVVAVGSYGSNDTIAFNIPGAGVHTIAAAALPAIGKPMKIDGYSQPGAMPNTNGPGQGSNAVLKIELTISSGSLGITAGGCKVQGLAINGIAGTIYLLNAGGNTIAGNFLGTNASGTAATPHSGYNVVDIIMASSSPNNTIGGITPAARNVVSGTSDLAFQNSGIFLASTGNVVQGNLIGTNAAGTAAIGNDIGIYVASGDNNQIGGTSAAARNVISGNRLEGIELDTMGNLIQGNYVGTDISGAAALANGNFGIAIGGFNNLVGGTVAGAGNLVSGNAASGIAIAFGASGNIIQGNRVGTDASGTQVVCGHSVSGIEISGGGNTIGGAQPGAGNIVAFSKSDGVHVDGGTGTSILRNSIFANAGTGIHLGLSSPNVNDPGDTDNGPNGLQNYPVLSATGVGAKGFDIGATLDSALGVFHLEFFASARCGRFGHGEGQTFIGSADVASDNNDHLSFGPQLFATPAGQTAITATATDAAGNTSEFSQCLDDRIFGNGFERPQVVCL